MSKKYMYLLCLFCLISLSSCRAAPENQVATFTPFSPPAVPTASFAATATAETAAAIAPTTPPSTATAPAPAAAASPTVAGSQAPAPTFDATSTAIVKSLVAVTQPRLLNAYSSPDGAWRAEVLAYPCTKVVPGEEFENALDVLRIARLNDQQVFTAQTQLQNCGGLGAFGLGGIQWSPDSRYFYYTDAREGVPDGGGFYGWYKNIFRFDTTTNQTEYLGAGPFSPDGNKIAVIRAELQGGCHPGGVAVLDISGQVLAEYPFDIPPENCGFAYLSWSPDGSALAYTLAICSSSGTDCHSALYRVDHAGDQATRQVLLENQPTQYVNIAWNSPERLELWSNDGHWFYILATGALEPQP